MGTINPEKVKNHTINNKDYVWRAYSEKDTGLRLITLEDTNTGIVLGTPISNPDKRVAATKAWAGARHSRAPGTTDEIMHEMGEKGVDPDKKIDDTFRGYGHASVADMARIDVHFNNVPMHVPMFIFNDLYINGGQEKSTRYQSKFGKSVLPNIKNYLPKEISEEEVKQINEKYQFVGNLSLELFNKHKPLLTEAYTNFYKPENKKEESSLASRVLDSTRFFLLLGQNTGFSTETSARDWSRIISEAAGSRVKVYRDLGEQLKIILAPEKNIEQELGFLADAPTLIKHTEPRNQAEKNLQRLKTYLTDETNLFEHIKLEKEKTYQSVHDTLLVNKKFSSEEKMVAQHIIALWPNANYDSVINWVQEYSKNDTNAKKISEIIFDGYNHMTEIPNQLAYTSDMTVVFKGTLGELRDFNRHRGWGRLIQLPNPLTGQNMTMDLAEAVINKGYQLPLYLEEVPAFSKEKSEFNKDMIILHSNMRIFFEMMSERYGKDISYDFMFNVMPLSTQVNIHMHGNPKQANYFTSLRVRPGGHINYRVLSHEAAQLIGKSSPYLNSISENVGERPDPADRDQFFNRS